MTPQLIPIGVNLSLKNTSQYMAVGSYSGMSYMEVVEGNDITICMCPLSVQIEAYRGVNNDPVSKKPS